MLIIANGVKEPSLLDLNEIPKCFENFLQTILKLKHLNISNHVLTLSNFLLKRNNLRKFFY